MSSPLMKSRSPTNFSLLFLFQYVQLTRVVLQIEVEHGRAPTFLREARLYLRPAQRDPASV